MTESDSDGQLLTCKFNCIIHGIDAGCGKRMPLRYFPGVDTVLDTVTKTEAIATGCATCHECYRSLYDTKGLCGCRVCIKRDKEEAELLELYKKPGNSRVLKTKPIYKKKRVSSSATTPKKPSSMKKPSSSSATTPKTPTTMKKPAASPAASGEAK